MCSNSTCRNKGPRADLPSTLPSEIVCKRNIRSRFCVLDRKGLGYLEQTAANVVVFTACACLDLVHTSGLFLEP